LKYTTCSAYVLTAAPYVAIMLVMRDLNTNHKKNITSMIIVALIVLTGLTAVALRAMGSNGSPQTNKQAVANTSAESNQAKVESATIVEFKAVKNRTVLDQLKGNAKVVTKDSQYGQYVDSINGIQGGTGSKYWAFYVDGQMANIGAGEYTTKGGETITWKFE
jgi:hypothetical protein